MNIKKLNEDIEKILNEDTKILSLIDNMRDLKGKYFSGTSIKDGVTYAEVYDDEYVNADGDESSLYSDYTQDNIDIEFSENQEEEWVEWANWVNDNTEVEGKGYKFADYTKGGNLDDYEVSKRRGEKPDLNTDLFITLYINPSEFDGDFDKVAKDIDKYVLDCKKKCDVLKK